MALIQMWMPGKRCSLLVLISALGLLSFVVLFSARMRGERAIEDQVRPQPAYPLSVSTARPLGPRPEGLSLLTSTREAFDGAVSAGRTFVATTGGLLSYHSLDEPPRVITHLEGLPSASLRTLLLRADDLVIGDAHGNLALLTEGSVRVLRPSLPLPPGPILDMVSDRGVLYVLMLGVGLLAISGQRILDVGRETGADLGQATSLCIGPVGLLIGKRDGSVLHESGGKLTHVVSSSDEITALACTGPEVYVGTPLGLFGWNPGHKGQLAPLRRDLLITSLLDDGQGNVMVATLDDGVYALRRESDGRMREVAHHLPRQRIHRLRAGKEGGNPLALGDGGAFLLPATAAPVVRAHGLPGLSGPHVTALAHDAAGRLWVGTFEHGIDIIEGGAAGWSARDLRIGHRPSQPEPGSDNVNALLYRRGTQEMLAATVRGIDRYGVEGGPPRRIGMDDGLIGDQVQALDDGGAGLLAATNKGLTFLEAGAARSARSLYTFHGLLANRVYALASVGRTVFAGTLAGVSVVVEDRVVRSYPAGSGRGRLPAGWVTALVPCGEDLFVGTYGGGLAVVREPAAEAGEVRRLHGTERLHVNPGAMICEGATLWAGTLEMGLLRYDLRRGALDRLDGALLPSRSVTALHTAAPDRPLLIGTEAGLVAMQRHLLERSLRPLGS